MNVWNVHLSVNELEPLLDVELCLGLVLLDEARSDELEDGVVRLEESEFLHIENI
jgi:hypothetical protein